MFVFWSLPPPLPLLPVQNLLSLYRKTHLPGASAPPNFKPLSPSTVSAAFEGGQSFYSRFFVLSFSLIFPLLKNISPLSAGSREPCCVGAGFPLPLSAARWLGAILSAPPRDKKRFNTRVQYGSSFARDESTWAMLGGLKKHYLSSCVTCQTGRRWCCGLSNLISSQIEQGMARQYFGGLFPSPLTPFGVGIFLWATFPWMKGRLVSLSFLEASNLPSWDRRLKQNKQGLELENFFQTFFSGTWHGCAKGRASERCQPYWSVLAFLTKQDTFFCKSWAWRWCRWNFRFTGIFALFPWEAVERGGWERIDPGWLNLIKRQISLVAGKLQQTEFLCWMEADFQTSQMLEFLCTFLLINLH